MALANVHAECAVQVLNSFCFDFLLRLRSAGSTLAFTYMRPLPVPRADIVERLPTIQTRLVWRDGTRHITDDSGHWEELWAVEKAVAEAYGLNAADFGHILSAFPVFARKRPDFFAFLRERLTGWH